MAKKGREDDSPIAELSEQDAERLAEMASKKLTLPKKYLSYSQVNMYLRCPRQYFFRYVQDTVRPPGISMVLGKGTHAACETTHHHLVDHQTPAPDEMLLDVYSGKFDTDAEEVDAKELKAEGVDLGQVKDQGARLVKLYNKRMAPNIRPQVVNDADGKEVRGIEKKFEVNVGAVPMKGYIDLIDTNADAVMSETEKALIAKQGGSVPPEFRTVIADLKTKAKSATAAEVDGSLQLTLYSFVEQIPLVRFDQLLKQKVPKVKRTVSRRTTQDHLWLIEVVTQVAEAISAGVFPPTDPTSWACSKKWCGFWNICRGKKR
jgi:hypothetical protein